MIVAIGLALVAALPFCMIAFAFFGLPVYMGVTYVAAGIAASLPIRHLLSRPDPLRRLTWFFLVGAVAGAAIGLLTQGLSAVRFWFRLDVAVISALLGGLGAVLYAILSTATERAPRAKRNPEENARFLRKLRRVAANRAARKDKPPPA